MKKRKLKLTLNKKTISKLQNDQMDGVRGGEATRTFDVACGNTVYPACAISGCWGKQTCFDTDPTFPG